MDEPIAEVACSVAIYGLGLLTMLLASLCQIPQRGSGLRGRARPSMRHDADLPKAHPRMRSPEPPPANEHVSVATDLVGALASTLF